MSRMRKEAEVSRMAVGERNEGRQGEGRRHGQEARLAEGRARQGGQRGGGPLGLLRRRGFGPGSSGSDGQPLRLSLEGEDGWEVSIGCANPVDVPFSDCASEDPQRRDAARRMVRMWAQLAKMGYEME